MFRHLAAVLAVLAALALPRPAAALFHLAVIDEVLTSYGGDPEVQFVEIRMQAGAQNFTANSVLGSFDAEGAYIGDVLVVPGNVANEGDGVRWLMGTTRFAQVSGLAPDFTMPPGLPPGGGMICWGAPGLVPPADPGTWDHTDPNQYVDCVAYGDYRGPSNSFIGNPTPLAPDAHSLVRVAETHDSATDFACADSGDPTNNAGASATLTATNPCASTALSVPFTGTLEIAIAGVPPFVAEGRAVALVSTSGTGASGTITGLTVPAGAFATALTVPVPNILALSQLRLVGPGGSGLAANATIQLQSGGTCTATHAGVSCPGGGLAGFGGLSGSLVFPFRVPLGTLSLGLPLAGLGGGSTTAVASSPYGASLVGAGWTTGAVSVATAMGTGSRMTDSGRTRFRGDAITIVSPVSIAANAPGPELGGGIGRIRLTLPEPGPTALLLAAMAALAGIGALRRRS